MQHTHSHTGEVASGGTWDKAEGSGRWDTVHKQEQRVLWVSEADELSQYHFPFSISASILKGTSSVLLALSQIFYATFLLPQVFALHFLPSLSLHLLDLIILLYVL